ncbi:MAG TPA: polyprenyl diphosphate synthase [Candidatus Eremiobacteraceae bacterium]|nr:polyprenyl diphosphate synthase [Candidatus Eremiobacteraceae bacterium]
MTLDASAAATAGLDPANMPRHLAVIMDGNRRWARERRLPAVEGHRRGVTALRELVRACSELGVPTLTVYAFSTDNWKRDAFEISLLLDLLVHFAGAEEAELNEQGVRVHVIGRINELPPNQREALRVLSARTAGNSRLVLNLAINYSARAELADAVAMLAADVAAGRLAPADIGEDTLRQYLYTKHVPDPDVLIRTGGEMRLSNFMLWQVAYTELHITDIYWPDFRRTHLLQAISDFQKRARRFGGS